MQEILGVGTAAYTFSQNNPDTPSIHIEVDVEAVQQSSTTE